MITITRGDSHTFVATVFTDSALTTAQDLSGVTAARFTARQANESGAVVFQKTLGDGVTVTDSAQGKIEIAVAPKDTASLPSRQAQIAYDLELTWSGGTVTTVDLGTMLVRPDVSY